MTRTRNRGHTSRLGGIPIALILLLVAGAALGTMYFVNGHFPWESPARAAQRDDGKVAVPLSGRKLSAYNAVERADLVDAKGNATLLRADPEQARKSGYMTDLSQVIGRVMVRDKDPGYAFTESDFLPRGSRPGWTGAIPEGYRGLTVTSTQIEGLRALSRGDRFDLVAVRPVRPEATGRDTVVSADVARMRAEASLWDAPSKVVANAAIVMVAAPAKPSGSGRDEVNIAVREEDHQSLLDALRLGAKISCSIHSGRKGAEPGPLQEDTHSVPVETIEVWIGGTKRNHVLPKQGRAAGQLEEGG